MKKDIFKRKRRLGTGAWRKNNRGVTMVETLVAFTVLMIIFGILYTVVSFCATLRMRAQDTSRAIATFSREMYNKDNQPGKNANNHILIKTYTTSIEGEDKSPLFYLSLSEDTSEKNLGTEYYDKAFPSVGDSATEEEKAAAKAARQAYDLSLSNIDAITYVYLPGTGENAENNDLKIIVPKAIQFIHKEEP